MSIALDQVTKRYQSTPVVNDVSLTVDDGEFLVLLGPSGSGKSTLLRAIAGLIEIDHGRIALHGRDVTGVPARDREVGFVFQNYALFRHMTVADNIEFALRVRRTPAAERVRRRRELLRLVALEGLDDRMPAQLSGGQQQRVAVARALAHRPRVLLMDEPFGALDARIREELRRTIRQIQRELGIATILVTHDQEEAFALADRIGVMHQGRLLECNRPEELYVRPATRFVATFLGAANLLLAYRNGAEMSFTPPRVRPGGLREAVAVLRPEEVTLAVGDAVPDGIAVGRGVIEEVLLAGAVQRLRVRMTGEAPRVAVRQQQPAEAGWLMEVTRTPLDQRKCPLKPGMRVMAGARRIHLLPTPISSFAVLADDAVSAAALRDSPLLAELAERMQALVTTVLDPDTALPPGLVVVEAGPRGLQQALRQLRHGATQLLCLPPAARVPSRVVIFAAAPEARDAVLAVAASVLRHLPAEAVHLAVRGRVEEEQNRADLMRDLLDARAVALARHGLDMRTELRVGDADEELLRELSRNEDTLLVLGLATADDAAASRLAHALGAVPRRPVLVVRPLRKGDGEAAG